MVGFRIFERSSLLPALFFLSGIPAMIYQVGWQRILVLLSGVGSHSITTIVASFMAGLGIGSLMGGRITMFCNATWCMAVFALVEFALGAIGYASSAPSAATNLRSLLGGSTDPVRMAFAQMAFLILPTTLMGMTFPLLTKALVAHGRRNSQVIGQLYGMNLLGAAFGSLLAPWVLFPAFGISGALRTASFINLSVAALALAIAVFAKRAVESSEPEPAEESLSASDKTSYGEQAWRPTPVPFWYFLTFLSGAVSIGLEIVWFRLVDIGTKATSVTFGTVLAIYLAGLAAGTFFGMRRLTGSRRPVSTFLVLQMIIVTSSALPVIVLVRFGDSLPVVRNLVNYWGSYEPVSPANASFRQLFELYALLPVLLFFVPTFAMGAAFVVLHDGLQNERRLAGQRVGWAQALNIFGCVLGSILVGLVGFDRFGSADTLRLLIGMLASAFLVSAVIRIETLRNLAFIALTAVLIFILPDNDDLWRRFHGRPSKSLFSYVEDDIGVSSILSEGGRWRVSTNGKGQSHVPFGGVHSKLGALPATFVERPKRIAIIGLGSGDTAWAASCRGETESIDVFEICDAQWILLGELYRESNDRKLNELLMNRRIRRLGEDGRIGIRRSPELYDLIEADAIRPNGAYAGNLYSEEFFRECLERLAPGGIMCTWSPTPRTLDTFTSVFPYVLKIDGGQILIGMANPPTTDLEAWKARLESPEIRTYLGPEIQAECLSGIQKVEVIRNGPATADRAKINTDLFPKDEFETD